MKVLKWLDESLEESIMVVLLVAISAVMLAQIFARYVFNSSMSWPEEFCRYCYVWSVFISLGYTIRRGSMLRVGIVMDMLPAAISNSVKILCDAVMLALFAVFFRHSLLVVDNIKNVTGEISSAMQIPMWIMYMCAVIGFALAAVRTVQSLVNGVRHFKDKGETTIEATIKEARAEVELAAQDNKNYGAAVREERE
ncbi:TRAP transporter small permease [Synergistes jonesii]|uniref:Tripartite ATP-independent periplasmic transporters DctQ component domain-containing protein n=1 Tax=Synergistes jonesii TaxID=2754 RepID=A0A073IUA4_9BACT|nr:TRAP transporter small permease [Synergistes jonesii]KEJ93016.1 hypothetical protein EH55_13560 [Synergistes jonesii]